MTVLLDLQVGETRNIPVTINDKVTHWYWSKRYNNINYIAANTPHIKMFSLFRSPTHQKKTIHIH